MGFQIPIRREERNRGRGLRDGRMRVCLEEARAGKGGAAVILLTESDHFIYLHQEGDIKSTFYFNFSFSCWGWEIKQQAGMAEAKWNAFMLRIYSRLCICVYSYMWVKACACEPSSPCTSCWSKVNWRPHRKVMLLFLQLLFSALSQFKNTC